MRTRQTIDNQRTVSTAIAMVVCLAAAGGAMPSYAAGPTKSAPAQTWRPAACPPPPERGRGPSRVTVTGPCGFEYRGEATCEAEYDDLLVILTRPAKNSAEVMLFINIERYVGPRTYKGHNDMWVGLKEGSKIYRWSTAEFEATVGPGSKFVTIKNVRLEPEPVLIGCTGPQTNFQCDGRGDEDELMKTITTVSGTIYCKGGRVKKP
jgi:hypothetical protein